MASSNTDLAATIERIHAAWADLQEACAGLDDDRMQEPGVSGDWSVKDVLAHVAVWDGLALRVLPGILETGRHVQLGEELDAFNARMTAEKRALPLDAVRRELEETHQRLLDALAGVDPEAFATNAAYRERLAADTWDHYPEHTAAIRAFREARGW